MPEREACHSSYNHPYEARELLRKVAVADQLAYQALLGFYRDFCRSPLPSGYDSLKDASFVTNSLAPQSHELIVMRQRDEQDNPATSLNENYLLVSHDIESGITTPYEITTQTILDHSSKDLFHHVGDSLAVQFEAISIPSQLSPVQRKISLLATNRQSIFTSDQYPKGQLLQDIGNLPYEVAYDLSSPRSSYRLDEHTLQDITLLPGQH